jgi:hypothetical protein
MPVSPRRQAELRAQKKRLEDPKKLPRKHCKNCNKLFPLSKPWREFCGDNCRKEFHANGGNAFGPLKTRLEKLVRQITGELERRLNVQGRAIGNLERVVLETFPGALEGSTPAQSPSQPSPTSRASTGHWHDPSGRL